MTVWNMNPKESPPIMVISKWRADPNGGPAMQEQTSSVSPGDGIDLRILGLLSTEEIEIENFRKELG